MSCVDIIITSLGEQLSRDVCRHIHEEDDDDGIDVTIDTTQCATCDTICNDILSIDKLFSPHASQHDTNISFLLSTSILINNI